MENEYFEISINVFNKTDLNLFKSIIDKGIDSRLEGFVNFYHYTEGDKLYLNFHYDEIQILIRRLIELQNKYENYDDDFNWYLYINYWVDNLIHHIYGYEMI